MLVREILAIKGKVLYATAPQRTLKEAVEVMNGQDVGSLVVMEDGAMAGMLTFREVLAAMGRAGAAWESVLVSDAMMRQPRVGAPTTEIDALRRDMIEHHQRYLPIMEGDTLLGVISFHDVARAVLEEQSFENRMLKNYIRNWPESESQPQ
ncbi:MAG: CBS domain-containing protein [Rhodocyclaceae bacterium]